MRPPIYEPKGKAKKYGDLALNIYTGCPHRCYYCFAPGVLHKEHEAFHGHVEPRPGIVEEVRKQLEKEKITGKLIHLCFTCDPYPTGHDSSATREIIKLLKEHGNHVHILTKGDGSRDFDLLDGEDWYGITISTADNNLAGVAEPFAIDPAARLMSLLLAKKKGIKTWVSFEPVIDVDSVLTMIGQYYQAFDRLKIGKLNYHPSDIDWAAFGRKAEALCETLCLDYYIMDELKPCPFCGAKAELDVELTKKGRPKFFRIRCTNIRCGAMIVKYMPSRGPNNPKLSGNDPLEAYSAKYQKRLHAFNDWRSERAEDAVITWNRRTS